MNNFKSFRKIAIVALVLLSGAVFNSNSFGQQHPIYQTPQQPGGQRLFDLSNQPSSQTPAVNAQTAPTNGYAAQSIDRSGAIRVGVMLPKFTSNGKDAGNAESIRSQISNYLQSPGVEIVLLGARVPVQAQLEAQQLGCGYILFTTVEKKSAKNGGGFGGMFGKLSETVGKVYLPGANTLKQAIRKDKITKASNTAALLAGLIKEKDEVSFEYQLATTSNLQFVSSSRLNANAAATGQDVISDLIEKAVGDFLPKMFELTPPKTMNTPTMPRQSQGQNQPQISQTPMPNGSPTSGYQPTQAQTNTSFNANIQSPMMKGVRLGMSFDEVKAQTNTEYSNRPDVNGIQRVSVGGSDSISQNEYTFFDGKLIELDILYQDIRWKSLEEFITVFSGKLGLPTVWNRGKLNGFHDVTYELVQNGYILQARPFIRGGYRIKLKNSGWEAVYTQRVEANKIAEKQKLKNDNEQKKVDFKP